MTVKEQLDETTGLAQKFIIDTKDASMRPRVAVLGADGEVLRDDRTGALAQYALPQKTQRCAPTWWSATTRRSSPAKCWQRLRAIRRRTSRARYFGLIGGLPRVAELFEARKPKDHAVMSEVDGIVEFGKPVKGKMQIFVVPEYGNKRAQMRPRGD